MLLELPRSGVVGGLPNPNPTGFPKLPPAPAGLPNPPNPPNLLAPAEGAPKGFELLTKEAVEAVEALEDPKRLVEDDEG